MKIFSLRELELEMHRALEVAAAGAAPQWLSSPDWRSEALLALT
jgi:hypothetical protein